MPARRNGPVSYDVRPQKLAVALVQQQQISEMKHASPLALESISKLISEIRDLPGLAEKKTGIFYKSGKAFLHFHEDSTGMFADARIDENEFSRFPVN